MSDGPLRHHLDATQTQIRRKPNYTRWWHRLAAWLATALLTIVGRDFRDYWTTLGATIYAPAGHEVDLDRPADYATVCHELAHRYDDRAHGWRYRISYLTSADARARWELRGYGMAIVAWYRRTGSVPRRVVEHYADAVSGPAYLWAIDRATALDTFVRIVNALRHGDLPTDLYDPNRPEFATHIPE